MNAAASFDDVVVIAIGRNEGENLRLCLSSAHQAGLIVYVDSGSTDNSVSIARELGAVVVDLDMSIPFTAARARNAGFSEAMRQRENLRYVQFVDGDCELQPDWLERAYAFLTDNTKVAAVCGRRRERFPQASIYNEICDVEWEVSEGPSKYCGGDVLMRCEAVQEAGGYRDDLIAGEEPELCVRLRQLGWGIYVLNAEMTLHDAKITRFGQWWQRMRRSGWAYAAGFHLHGRAPEHHWVWQTLQAWIWVMGPLLAILMLAPLLGWYAGLILGVYPLQWLRLCFKLPGSLRRRSVAAFAYTVGRFAEFSGQCRYLFDHFSKRTRRLIEYK